MKESLTIPMAKRAFYKCYEGKDPELVKTGWTKFITFLYEEMKKCSAKTKNT